MARPGSDDRAADGAALGWFDERLARVETAFNLIAALFIFALMFLGIAQVLGRKLFNAPMVGYIDFVELSMATFAFLGVAYCQRLGDHVRMELFLTFLKGRALWMFEAFATLAGLFIIAVLIYYGFEHFLRAYQLGDSTIDAEYPVWPSKLLVPVAFSLLWLRLLVQLVGFLRLARRPQATPVAVPLVRSVAEQAAHEIEEIITVHEHPPGR